ncbi:MAG: ribonuclease HI [Eubacteriales bacterium]|nr:ribonuclease HI [Eubacteriales bacterium]
MPSELIIYTDGACSGNPGPGGWAYLLRFGETEKTDSGYVPDTTNNRMEMLAAIKALEALNRPCKVALHSDSAYLVRAFNDRWYLKWEQNGWRNSAKQAVANPDLWQQLLKLSRIHEIEWIKVKGHSTDELNNLVDALAVKAMREGMEKASQRGE